MLFINYPMIQGRYSLLLITESKTQISWDNFAVSLMAESRIHQESSELIPDPMLTRLTRTEYWIWDQSDQGNRISSDGRNTWNRAGLIPE